MATPTIIIDSATGSDTTASGSQGAISANGTSASFSGSVVTLDGSPDLSGFNANDDILWLATTTGRQWFDLSSADDGADTVTCVDAPSGTASGLTWAIGGKRASIGATSSRLLLYNGGDGDAKGGWIVEMADGHSETISATLLMGINVSSPTPFIFRGEANAVTMPVINIDINDHGLETDTNTVILRDFHLKSTYSGTPTALSDGLRGYASSFNTVVDGLKIERFYIGVNGYWWNQEGNVWINLEVFDSVSHGVSGNHVLPCFSYIHDNGGVGIRLDDASMFRSAIVGNVIANNTGDGIYSSSASLAQLNVINNTIYGNGGDGIDLSPASNYGGLMIVNNLITNNTGYGYRGNSTWTYSGRSSVFKNNNTFGNTAGATLDVAAAAWEGDPQLDPQYTNAAGEDWSVGANMKAEGFPESNIHGSSSRSYWDIGAVQRQEPAGFIRRTQDALIGR